MKKLILVLMMGLSISAFAQEKIALNCTVPSGPASGITPVTITLSLIEDVSADYVMVTITDGASSLMYYSQAERGAVAARLAQGGLGFPFFSDDSQQVNGVISKAGFFSAGRGPDGSFGGLLSAAGSLFPLSCEVPKVATPEPLPTPTPAPVPMPEPAP